MPIKAVSFLFTAGQVIICTGGIGKYTFPYIVLFIIIKKQFDLNSRFMLRTSTQFMFVLSLI